MQGQLHPFGFRLQPLLNQGFGIALRVFQEVHQQGAIALYQNRAVQPGYNPHPACELLAAEF